MTTTDPAIRTAHPAHADSTPELPSDAVAATFLDYGASEYTALASQLPRMPMDVEIAATLGLGFETRDLTAAIRSLEVVIADHTATMKAFLAQQGGLVGLEEAEAAIDQLPAPEQQT